MQKFFYGFGFIPLILWACASQQTRVTCAEVEYRLNSMSYSPDQRAFLEEELRQCREKQREQEKDDVLTNKLKGSIYDRFRADSDQTSEKNADSLAKENLDSKQTIEPLEETASQSELKTAAQDSEDTAQPDLETAAQSDLKTAPAEVRDAPTIPNVDEATSPEAF